MTMTLRPRVQNEYECRCYSDLQSIVTGERKRKVNEELMRNTSKKSREMVTRD